MVDISNFMTFFLFCNHKLWTVYTDLWRLCMDLSFRVSVFMITSNSLYKINLPSIIWVNFIHDDVIKWKHFPCYWPLWGESTDQRWFPLTKVSNAELWVFDVCLQRRLNEMLVIWDTMAHHDIIVMHWQSVCNHRYGLIVYGWGKITYSYHLYFMAKFVLYVLSPAPFVSHIGLVSVGQWPFWKLMLFVDVTDMK